MASSVRWIDLMLGNTKAESQSEPKIPEAAQ